MRDIYSKKGNIKLILLILALLIGAGTLMYTDSLVKELAKREISQIDIYSKALKKVIDAPIVDESAAPEANNYINSVTAFLYDDIVESNLSIPVILTDSEFKPLSHRNINFPRGKEGDSLVLASEIREMRSLYQPIEIKLGDGISNYVFYKNSYILTKLKLYPFIQLIIISCFILIAYMAFSYSRRAEQNRVWVGLAKETAHQLGTPLSSLMAWMEHLKTVDAIKNEHFISELEKDIKRLETITERFSNIGSSPILNDENAVMVVSNYIQYLKNRVSKQVEFKIVNQLNEEVKSKINIPLFEWVIENISKNAIDAMKGKGTLTITFSKGTGNSINIDIADTGKGMTKSQQKQIFEPGFTTKKRGWGLGLTLAKRIIESYHNGKLILKNSQLDEGTIFRITI